MAALLTIKMADEDDALLASGGSLVSVSGVDLGIGNGPAFERTSDPVSTETQQLFHQFMVRGTLRRARSRRKGFWQATTAYSLNVLFIVGAETIQSI